MTAVVGSDDKKRVALQSGLQYGAAQYADPLVAMINGQKEWR